MRGEGALFRPGVNILEKFREHGVDTSVHIDLKTPEGQRQRDQKQNRDAKAMQSAYAQQKAGVYYSYSLWSGDQPLHFSFERWHSDRQQNVTEAKRLATTAYQVAEGMLTNNQALLMIGRPGVGKTSLALAMMDWLKDHGKSVMFVSTAELTNLYSEQYEMTDVKQKIDNIIRAMKEVDVLVLDDFGTEGGLRDRINQKGYKGVHSDMQRGMYQVANARYDLDKNQRTGSTIITSNNTLAELGKMYDPKILSRLVPRDPKYQLSFNRLNDIRGLD